MKYALIAVIGFIPSSLFGQKQQTAKSQLPNAELLKPAKEVPKFEPIKLWFVMLIKGSNRSQDSITAAKLQEDHMANIAKMWQAGKLLVAGPFLEDSNWRGLFILKCESKEEAEKLIQQDPAIAAGRLAYEIHPWMTGKNCLFQ